MIATGVFGVAVVGLGRCRGMLTHPTLLGTVALDLTEAALSESQNKGYYGKPDRYERHETENVDDADRVHKITCHGLNNACALLTKAKINTDNCCSQLRR